MTATLSQPQAEELLGREALYLDRREFDAWLGLYTQDAVFWAPAWRDETTLTSDPDRELSLIYYAGRHNLEDRVWRVKSGLSVASQTLPRTVHAVTNVLVESGDADSCAVTAAWTVHQFNAVRQTQHVFFGRYDYRLLREDDTWRIAAKTVLIFNDRIPTVADFYSV